MIYIKQLLIICFLIGIFSFIFESNIYAKSNNNYIITIDPGHGGKDPGTSYKNILEKNINLEISKKLKIELEKKSYKVYLTREGDYDLSKPNAISRKKSDFDNRIKLINEVKSNMYLSIHLNYLSDSRYSGAQVFYNKDNQELAEIIQKELNKRTNSNRQIKQIPDLYMYKRLNIPGVLIECGFISNSNERIKLQDNKYQLLIADSIADAIEEYYNWFHKIFTIV